MENVPQGVLIRGAGTFDGPGKLTRALQIDKTLNGADLVCGNHLWLEQGEPVSYVTTPRIGIDYATEPYRSIRWRFVAEDSSQYKKLMRQGEPMVK